MKRTSMALAVTLLTAWALLTGCQKKRDAEPELTPQLKTAAELAAAREEQIRSGQVVPASAPALETPRGPARPAMAPPPPLLPGPGAIAPDILMVNRSVLTVSEVLYPLRGEISAARRSAGRGGLPEAAQRLIREQTQRDVGVLLVYEEATSGLGEPQKDRVKEVVQRTLDDRVSREFGGSTARLVAHLGEYGLTLEQYRARLERELVVRQYSRERLMPQVRLTRAELLAGYRDNEEKYSSPETREFCLIEAPFARFLSPGLRWNSASAAERAQARLRAEKRIEAAAEALRTRSFDEVAREFCSGVHASQGGSWGPIGKPLNKPYDELSALIFRFREGQISDPIETPTGWYIVRCGKVTPAQKRTFAQVQDELREELADRKFARLSSEYVMKLAQSATISSLDAFIAAALRRAESLPLAPEEHAQN